MYLAEVKIFKCIGLCSLEDWTSFAAQSLSTFDKRTMHHKWPHLLMKCFCFVLVGLHVRSNLNRHNDETYTHCRIEHILPLSAFCTSVMVCAQSVHDLARESGANEVCLLSKVPLWSLMWCDAYLNCRPPELIYFQTPASICCHHMTKFQPIWRQEFTVIGAGLPGLTCSDSIIDSINHSQDCLQEDDFIAYMFGFQDSQGLADIPKAVADLLLAEEQLSALPVKNIMNKELNTALIVRLRFRRNFLNVRSFLQELLDFHLTPSFL